MKVSTRGRYGLRAMLELARCYGDDPVLMGTLAEREDISRKYLHTLLTGLKSAGLVRSLRGARGGFVLTRHPSEIKLAEILHVLEGPLSLVDCVADERACDRAERCTARRVWQELSGAIDDVLENVTLEDLIAPDSGVCSEPGVKKDGATKKSRPRKQMRRSGASGTTSRDRQGALVASDQRKGRDDEDRR
jgi:Rrf2 family cysteine metabolism transcriptional repressor